MHEHEHEPTRFDNTPIPYSMLLPAVSVVDAVLVGLERLLTLCQTVPEEQRLGAIREELEHTDPLVRGLILIHAQHALVSLPGPFLHVGIACEILERPNMLDYNTLLNSMLRALHDEFHELVNPIQERLNALRAAEGKPVPWDYPPLPSGR